MAMRLSSSSSHRSLPSLALLLLLHFLLSLSAASPDLNRVRSRGDDDDDSGFDPRKVTQLSSKPRIFLYKGFLSNKECNHLISLAMGNLQKSLVVDNELGKSIESKERTSSGMFLSRGQDEIVSRIERRISTWTLHPKENGEGIQILHYKIGQKYDPHFDYFFDESNIQFGGQRVLTVLMYLSNVQRGGETIFPNSEEKNNFKHNSLSNCSKMGLAVKPQKGDALLFFSLHPDATKDPLSFHGGCPVLEGDKWSATKWVHVRAVNTFDLFSRAMCMDQNHQCPHWAAAGECKKNPAYMIGSDLVGGACRKSCHACNGTFM